MSPKQLVKQIQDLQFAYTACSARLNDPDDTEALHDLRVCLRRLRSLLKPLAKVHALKALNRAARDLAARSNPIRDLEVLLAALAAAQAPAALLEPRQAALREAYQALLDSPLRQELDDKLGRWITHPPRKKLPGKRLLRKRIHRQLQDWMQELYAAMQDEAHDKHVLRIIVKRLRYTLEAYPDSGVADADFIRLLKKAQGALGDWHDHFMFLHRIEQEPDLAPFAGSWAEALEQHAHRADTALQKLSKPLNKTLKKTARK